MADPKSAAAVRQADAALRGGDLPRAEAICRQILKLNRRDPNALLMLAQILDRRGESAAAADILAPLVTRRRDPELLTLLGRMYINAGAFDDAIEQFGKALAVAPDHVPAIAGQADVHERCGRLDEAEAVFAPLVETRRDTMETGVVQCRVAIARREYEQAIAVARRNLLAGPPNGPKRHFLFLLGKALERSGQYDEAFDAYRQGNDVLKMPFDTAEHVRMVDGIMASYSAQRMGLMPRLDPVEDAPVFIIGMFRSGSTLVETIIDAHPEAAGAGETQIMRRLSESLMVSGDPGNAYARNVHELKAADLRRLRDEYLAQLAALATPAACVVDKSLGNYMQLGFMTALLGRPRVIHCRRNPLDTCFSCYAEHLAVTQSYCNDLTALGVVHRQYERLMDHWRGTLDIPLLEVDYEQVVQDPETQTRRILEFCDLPWNDACLRFHESKRVAHTSSYAQIRQPIYQSAVSRAGNFEKHLGPLIRTLGEG